MIREHLNSSVSILSYKKEETINYPDLVIEDPICSHPLKENSLPLKKHTFMMRITDLSKRPHGHKLVVKSTKATIDIGLPQPTKWCLLLYPNRSGFVSMYLYRWDNQSTPIPATFSFSVLNSYQEKSNTMDVNEKKMFGGNSAGTTRSLGATKFVSREHLLDPSRGLVHNDTLTVICQINVFGSGEIEDTTVPSSVHFNNLVEELHFLPHPEEENYKKKAQKSGLDVAMHIGIFNHKWFLHSIENWKNLLF